MHDSNSSSNRQRELSFDSVYSDDDSQCSDSDNTTAASDKWQRVSNSTTTTTTADNDAAVTNSSNDTVLDETIFSELIARFSIDADQELPELDSTLRDDSRSTDASITTTS